MIYIINNNTTHNYSRYSTGPSRIYRASLNVNYPIQNMTNPYAWFGSDQPYVFQTKQLLCWGPDIAFFNLRNTFSNIFKALQICWSAARNNKKILFINGKDSIVADSTLVNTWLMLQYKRHSMPRKLNNICNVGSKYITHLAAPSPLTTGPQGKHPMNAFENKVLFNHLSTFLNSCCIKMPGVVNTKVHSFIKNSNSLFNCIFTQSKAFYAHYSKYPHQPKTKQAQSIKTYQFNSQTVSKDSNPNVTADLLPLQKQRNPLCKNENQLVSNYNQLKIKTKNAIRLQVKEGQTLTQQIAGEISVPLVGFLTNTNTGFNALQNQLNDEFHNQSKSVYFNNCLNTLVKNVVHMHHKNLGRQPALYHDISNHNYNTRSKKLQYNCSTCTYHQYYLPFSFYVRSVDSSDVLGLLPLQKQRNRQCKQKQHMVRQNVFGKILAWRLKSQHPSSLFYSQFKILNQPNKYKSKQRLGSIANKNNIDAVVHQLKLASSKSQVLFKNSNNFITFIKPVGLIRNSNKTNVNFYSNRKPSNIDKQTADQSTVFVSPVSSADTSLALLPLQKQRYHKNSNTIMLKASLNTVKSNSINNFYISRFYNSMKNSVVNKNQNRVRLYKSSATELFKANRVSKVYKGHSRQLISRQFLLPLQKQRKHDKKKFSNYYDKLINSNQLNQYQMFAKSPYVNNKLADIVFFINPEKNQNLVNQANSLKIPTIGVISGMPNSELGRRSCNHYSLNNLVNYPILGNPSSSFFIYTLIGVFVKALRSS